MSGEFEAIGDAVTGGLLARAVEPQAGEVADGHTHEKSCLNCGTPLTGPYCSVCGQKAHVHRSIRGFLHDFVQGLFNFEGKIWRTLPMLAWRPGEMTRRYIAGERARFISPVALYLFTVFLMFAVLNFTGTLSPGGGALGSGGIQRGLKAAIAEDQAALAKLEAKRRAAAAAGTDLSGLDRQIAKRKEDIADSQKVLSGEVFTSREADADTPSWVRPLVEQAVKNPEQLTTNIQDAASKFSWLLIPISVPFLWLLFPLRRRYNTYDHAVFVTYSLSFMMMLVVIGGLLVAVGLPSLASLLFLVPPFHMYRHLKGAYQLGRTSAVLRTMALVTFAFVAAGLFFVMAVALGAM
jgi:hypothetical protein